MQVAQHAVRLKVLRRRAHSVIRVLASLLMRGRTGRCGDTNGQIVASSTRSTTRSDSVTSRSTWDEARGTRPTPTAQIANAEGDRRIHRAASRGAATRCRAGFGLGLVDLRPTRTPLLAARKGRQNTSPSSGQRQPPRSPRKQTHTESRLQVPDVARDTAAPLRIRMRIGYCANETAGIDHRSEGAHFEKSIHCSFTSA